jgi:hypothetical protein
VPLTTSTTLSADYNGVTKSVTFTVDPSAPAALAALGLSPASVVGGASSIGTVALTAPAPSGGAVVRLSISNRSLTSVPATIVVPAGATAQTFMVTTAKSGRSTSVTISAAYAGVTRSATIIVKRR